MTTALSPAKVPPSFAMLDVRSIAPDATQVRRTFDHDALAELAISIREHGIIEPIIVRPGAEADSLLPDITHTLIAGERRWRAAMLAGLDEVPAIIRSDLQGEDLAVVQVLENLQRADLTLPELGAGVAKLVHALGTAKTAAQLGKSEGWVSKHARLDALPECITACITAGALTSADMAHDLARMIELSEQLDHQTYRRDRLLEAAADGSLTRADLRQTISSFKEWIERNKAREAALAESHAERQQHAANAAADTYNFAPEEKAPDSPEAQQREAAQRAIFERNAAREAAVTAYDEATGPLMARLYLDLCAAAGAIPQTYDDQPDEPCWGHNDRSDYDINEANSVNRWMEGDIPPPAAFETRPITVNLPLLPAQLRRLIAALPSILSNDQAAQLGAVLAANPEAAATADTDNPPSFADWCAANLVADPSARTQCVDVHRAYNATQPEQWAMQDARWAQRAEEAGLTKKRFTNGYAYVGVRMVGGGE